VLPVLRAQGHGHIIHITSMGGMVGLPLAGAYIASKWALEGLSECLTQRSPGSASMSPSSSLAAWQDASSLFV
jgi:short-subunit dehydrogenase